MIFLLKEQFSKIKIPQKIMKSFAHILSVFFFFFLWWIFSKKICSSLILPSPLEVFLQIPKVVRSENFWMSFFATFCRTVCAFFVSFFLGFFLGFLCAKSFFFKCFFEFPLQVLRTTPVVAIILIALFWFDSSFLPVFIAVLMGLPVVSTAVEKSFSSVNEKNLFMAKIFRFSKLKTFFQVEVPECLPNILGAAQSVFGMSWKVAVAGEVLCLPKFAIGKMMATFQMNLETASVLCVTILLIFSSFVSQWILKILIKKICKKL